MEKSSSASQNINVAKIVSTPTLNAWSQAYNAGSLFAVLSLQRDKDQEGDSLNVLGKDIIDALEKEYFALEEKNLESIKEAILSAYKSIPKNLSISLSVVAVINKGQNILYAFLIGDGKIILKRGEKIGTILKAENEVISSSSGFLEDGDTVILETKKFSEIISAEELKSSFDHLTPSEIAEILSPKIHGQAEGGAAAIVLSFKNTLEENNFPQEEENTFLEKEEISSEEKIPSRKFIDFGKFLNIIKNHSPYRFSHSKKLFMTISVVLICVLAISLFFAAKKREENRIQTIFQETFIPAQKKYDEGQGLMDLNKNLAKEDFSQAKKILLENKEKFNKGSTEEKEILSLLAKIETSLNSTFQTFIVKAKPVDNSKSEALNQMLNKKGTFYAKGDKNIYISDEDGISSIDMATKKTKLLIKSTNWDNLGGIGTYLGNIYILDKESNKILKFASGKESTKSNYLSEDQDISKASSIAIDGSIFILNIDGSISKFTKGKSDKFSVSGLDEDFSNPTRIFTDSDTSNIYILDKGNSRIVVLDKAGNYQSQYQSKILKNAEDFEVLEKDSPRGEAGKIIYILSNDKIWQIDLK